MPPSPPGDTNSPGDGADVVGVAGTTTTLDRVIDGVHRVNRIAHFAAGAILLAIMLVTTLNVVTRAMFDTPVPGTVELTEMAMVLVVYLGFAHAEDKGDHIAVDLLYERLGRTAQLVTTALSGVVSLVVIMFVVRSLYQYALVLGDGGYTTAILQLPQDIVAKVGVLGVVLFCLALGGTVLAAIRDLRRGPT